MKHTTIYTVFAALVVAGLTLFSCVKTEFDDIPITGTPVNITPNTTIKALKALHLTPEGFDRISEDLIIAGVVVMDDRSGNYYKSIVIQDSTGGIELKFNDGFLYNQYPIGRTLYIKCKDLILTDYNGLTQLIGSTKEEAGVLSGVGITEVQAREQILKGLVSQVPPAPKVISVNQLSDPNLVSTLIRLDNVQFIKADTGKTFADPVTRNSLNRTLEDCNGTTFIMRTSGYSDFAASLTPGTNGSITAVLGTFGGTPQLFIRNTGDLDMKNSRCSIICGYPADGTTTVETIDQNFSGFSANQDINLPGWANVGTDGCRLWRASSFSGNIFAQATAFQSQDISNEAWLVTPAINASSAKTLSFETSWAYYKHQGLTVWYSTNFNGRDAAAANWQQLNCTIATQANGNGNFGDWVPSGNISLPVINGGKVYVGFKFVGDKTVGTTNWRLDNIKVQ